MRKKLNFLGAFILLLITGLFAFGTSVQKEIQIGMTMCRTGRMAALAYPRLYENNSERGDELDSDNPNFSDVDTDPLLTNVSHPSTRRYG